jgi:hypothetical protein
MAGFSLRGFSNPKVEFWKWFVANSDRLLSAPVGPGPEFHELAKRLRKVDPELTFELGGAPDQPRQLVISADGLRSAFQSVEELVDMAPNVPGWRIVRFKPREPTYADLSISMNGIEVGPKQIRYVLLEGWDRSGREFQLGVDLFIDGCVSEDQEEFVAAAFILLDGALGEYDVAMRMGRMRVFPGSQAPEHSSTWSTFAEQFDEQFERLTAEAVRRASSR